jgi:hypothetical protein
MEHMERMRPSQLATLLLASCNALPRVRARDQQADLAGSRLKQRVLHRVIENDPEPSAFLAFLDAMVAEFGEPSGPTRAVVRGIAEEWNAASTDARFSQWLLDQAVQSSEDTRR